MSGEADVFLLLILALFCPPIAVAFVAGCGVDLCFNILLTMLGYLPGCIHAFWLVFKRAEANQKFGYKNWTYIGMGEYRRHNNRPSSVQYSGSSGKSQSQAPPPPAPPQEQYPAGNAPLPSQAPVGEKPGGYEYRAAPAPADQQYQAPPQVPAEKKAAEVVPDQKQAESTAQTTAAPNGT